MKAKPQVHFWHERIGWLEEGEPGTKNYRGTAVYAVSACRAWDVPANGVFMIFLHQECRGAHTEKGYRAPTVDYRRLLIEKLEARERALVNYYGREARHHLDQFELTPAERRTSITARDQASEYEF